MFNNMICGRCKVELIYKKRNFSYMGHNFFADLPTCPCCGQVYISEELARGKIAEVEIELEDK